MKWTRFAVVGYIMGLILTGCGGSSTITTNVDPPPPPPGKPLADFHNPSSSDLTNNGNFLAAGSKEYVAGLYHLGKDMPEDEGTPVYAVGPGRVLVNGTATDDPVQKFMWVEFDLSDGSTFCAVYGHINSSKKVGQAVRTGEVIGKIASQSYTHLHFGVRPAGMITMGWGRGELPSRWNGDKSKLDRKGFVPPYDFLQTHHPASE